MLSNLSNIQYIEAFERPLVLLCLVVLPLFWLGLLRFGKSLYMSLPYPGLHQKIYQERAERVQSKHFLRRSTRIVALCVSGILLSLALVFATLALARPYAISQYQIRVNGIEIYFVLDLSRSMQAYDYELEEAERLQERGEKLKSRLDLALDMMRKLTLSRQERCLSKDPKVMRCDRLGSIVFAAEAFIDFPLTSDYSFILSALENRNIEDIAPDNSAIGDGIARAVASLRNAHSSSRNIILLSDGDQQGGRISIAQAIAAANYYDVTIYPISIGRDDWALVPETLAPGGRLLKKYFPVHPELIQKIAEDTGGRAYHAASEEELERNLSAVLDQIEAEYQAPEEIGSHTLDLSLPFIQLTFLFALLAFLIYTIYLRLIPTKD